MILAAGLGTRMRPLSLDRPKPLMPLWNRSLLARQIDLLRSWGVQEVLVNAHFGAAAIIQEVIELSSATCRLTLSHEPEILGTGGALQRAAWFFDDQPFWLLNADVVVANLDPAPLWQTLNSNPAILASCWVDPERGPRTVRVKNGQITDFAVSTPGAAATCTFCGLQCVRPQLLHWIPKTGFSSLIEAYERARKRGRIIAGVVIPGSYWADAGTPRRYLQVHRETAPFFAPHAKNPSVCVSPTAAVGSHVTLDRCVVWDRAHIDAGATVESAVIGRETRVSGSISGVALSAQHVLTAGEWQGVQTIIPDPPEKLTAILLPARGSARSYIRLQTAGWSGILMRHDGSRHENTRFSSIGRALRQARWPVPEIRAESKQERWLLLEDVGQEALGDRWASDPERVRSDYQAVVNQLLHLHGRVTRRFRKHPPRTLPPFDASVYRYERDLFTGQYLANYEPQLPLAIVHRIYNELARAVRPLQTLKPVYIHRDLQSSNIHWHHGGPVFIDFQGLRLGSAAYDLASLLLDPYVDLPADLQDELLARYARSADAATFSIEAYRIASVQRLCQALGAYARLSALPDCERFAIYIPVARQRLRTALEYVRGLRTLKALLKNPPHFENGSVH